MLNRPNLRHLPGLLALSLACPVAAQEFTTPRPSPDAKVIQTVGTTEMSVTYSRPGVKNRVVWGGLVPWGKAWRTGANEITQFQSADDVWVEGQKLAAGTYALVTTPNPDAVTFAFSTQKDMAGLTGYDPKTNVLSVTVKPVAAPHVERMQFTFDEPTTDEVTLTLRWEKLAVPLRLRVDTNGKTLAAARTAVAAAEDGRLAHPLPRGLVGVRRRRGAGGDGEVGEQRRQGEVQLPDVGAAREARGQERRQADRGQVDEAVDRVRQGGHHRGEGAGGHEREAARGVDVGEVGGAVLLKPPAAGRRGFSTSCRRGFQRPAAGGFRFFRLPCAGNAARAAPPRPA
jgi:hypothetical protein